MNHKHKVFRLVVIFVLLLIGGLVLMNAPRIGICSSSTCVSVASEFFGAPLAIGSFFILISLGAMIFLKENTYPSWKRFAVWFIPIWAVLTALTPSYSNYQIIPFMDLDRSIVAISLGIIYLAASFGIIIYQTTQSRKKAE